ncbi:GIY-YIG nuclease family protein, partial [Nocardioides salsibiostraticola]
MTNEDIVVAALGALADKKRSRAEAAEVVPKNPGLYAFYGDARAWSDLGLSPVFATQPLYVGKAERSLNGRDVGTHFTAGKTGSSTVRRSLAALLANDFELVAVPRNLVKPDGSANFGLEDRSEERLSAWMDKRLTLSTCESPWVGWSLHRFETRMDSCRKTTPRASRLRVATA